MTDDNLPDEEGTETQSTATLTGMGRADDNLPDEEGTETEKILTTPSLAITDDNLPDEEGTETASTSRRRASIPADRRQPPRRRGD